MLLVRWLCFALAIVFTAWIVPGIDVENFLSAMFAYVILGLINATLKPILLAITLPLNFLTIGLFTFVINAFLLMLAGWITPGLEVDGFLSALLGSLVLSLISIGISKI